MAMMPFGLRLHHRIVIPFVLVALLTTSGAALLALLVVSRTFESRIQAQILNTSEVVSRGGFALNPGILRSVKAITGADVITFTDDGTVLASTVEGARAGLIAEVTRSAAARRAFVEPAGIVTTDIACDAPCQVAYRRVSERNAVVAIVAETADVSAAIRTITRTIVVAAIVSVIAMFVVSQAVARRVTGPLDRLLLVTQDITEGTLRRRASVGGDEVGRLGQAFNEMLDRLERSQSALVRSEKLALAGLLAARVAHDIRNPLASIKIQGQMLLSRVKDDADSRTLVTAVLHDVGQLESVIRDLIELARPGELKRQPTNLNDVVRDVVGQLNARFSHRKIEVDADLSDRLVPIPLDADRFKQALLNVIVNATDAMPNGGSLDIDTQMVDGGAHIILDVCDDGVGIDPAMVDRVFDPFVSSKPDGVGLGLVNAKAVVESHGGRIELIPRRVRGTRARITLPVSG